MELSLSRLGQPGVRPLWLLGQPVAHSLSPLMQNLAFEALGLPAVYLAWAVAPDDLHETVRALALLGAVGANLTVPHKEAGFHLCGRLTPRAEAAGAVNCLRWREGGLEGDNTDGVGWLRGVESGFGWRPPGKRALILGAGGAARGVAAALLAEGIDELVVLNRTPARAESLLQGVLEATAARVGHRPPRPPRPPRRLEAGSLELFARELERTDLVVQTTSAGLQGEGSPVRLPETWPHGVLFSELIYGRDTPLLGQVRQLGGAVQDGLPMLVHQAVEGICWWFGVDPREVPADRMEAAARASLVRRALQG